jgi:hypothetical protein
MRHLALLSLTLVACGSPVTPSDGGLDLNDVSFLLPLPPAGHEARLLSLADGASHGVLLPKPLYDALPLVVDGADVTTLYSTIRVISVRVDPCFPGSTPPAPPSCVKQVRLVAQPVFQGGDDAGFRTTTEDATLHLFYDLTQADFDDVHRALWRLKDSVGTATDHQPLDVHPVMQREGVDGPYFSSVRSLVLDHCGAQNLVRVAYMSVAQRGANWRFGAFDVVDGALVAAAIPRIDGAIVQGVQEFGNTEFRSGQLLPSVSGDDLDVLLSESEMRLTDTRTLNQALTSALQIEHPARSSPKTIDCASCHVASRARHNAERQRQVDTSSWPDAFTADPRFDLRRVDAVGDDPKALRSFGYLGPRSALSQRTINESAVIATALSRTRP